MGKTVSRVVDIWYHMTLRRKLSVIIASVVVMMAASIYVNLIVVYYFVDHGQEIMGDNLSCYKFQDALEEEAACFARLIGERNLESEQAYKDSGMRALAYLEQLLFDYNQVGRDRYAITWSTRNSYGEYKKQKKKIIAMEADEDGYIRELYKVCSMQGYLNTYASRLTRAVLTEGNSYYEAQVPSLRRMPLVLILISITAFIALVAMLRFITGSIVKVLVHLASSFGKIEYNDFSGADVVWAERDGIGQLVSALDKMKHFMERYLAAAEEKRKMEEQLHCQELKRTQPEQRFSLAQLQLIKSQPNPHFLFNILNMITRMSQAEDAPVTEEMLVAMSNLLWCSLRITNAFTPLRQELKVMENYMYIQRIRLESRICWSMDCSRNLCEREVPAFLFQPLVENAVIHGIADQEEGGTIYIRIREKGELLRISVADTGAGIPGKHLREPQEASTLRGKRLGIGLGNIYHRITAHYDKGRILLDSREGCGTVIQMEFGKRKEQDQGMAGLMIAEDELIERMVLKKMLQKKFGEQCTIYEAQNGHETVELARREEIQVIILGIGMPGMNGIQAAKIIRREHPECCIIFLTAYDRFEYARSAISVGVMEYLLKPHSSREIIHATGEALHLADRYRTWRAGKDGADGDRAGGTGAEAAAGKDRTGGTGAGETASGEILPFTLRLMDELDQEKENDEPRIRLSLMVSMVEEHIRTHYMYEISMHDAAKAVNYSDPYFCKIFKQQFGQDFTSYLAEYRINEAKKLLCQPNVNVKDVGIRVGYPDNNYFTKVFRRLAGMNPSDCRMELLQKL